MEKINNATFVKELSKELGYSQKDIKEVMQGIEAKALEHLAKGDQVKVLPSLTMSIGERKAHAGINPATQEKITIPATKTVKVKLSPSFKESVKS